MDLKFLNVPFFYFLKQKFMFPLSSLFMSWSDEWKTIQLSQNCHFSDFISSMLFFYSSDTMESIDNENVFAYGVVIIITLNSNILTSYFMLKMLNTFFFRAAAKSPWQRLHKLSYMNLLRSMIGSIMKYYRLYIFSVIVIFFKLGELLYVWVICNCHEMDFHCACACA